MMFDKAEVIKSFPGTFRKHQKEVIEQVIDAYNCGCKCVIVEMPPGSGKSVCNVTVGNASKGALYFTPQITLVNQIKNSPLTKSLVEVIMGKRNYFCPKDPEGKLTVDVGPCETSGDKCADRKFVCPYYTAKQKAINAHIAVMPFSYAILEGRNENSSFNDRQLVIDDEAHNLGEDIVKQVAFIISQRTLSKDLYFMYVDKIRTIRDASEICDLISDIRADCETEVKHLQEISKTKKLTPAMVMQFQKSRTFIARTKLFETSNIEDWLIQNDTELYNGKMYPKLVLTPVTGRYFAKSLLWNKGDLYLLTSATFPRSFTSEIGLDLFLEQDEIKLIRVPSTFPVENRLIINKTVGQLTYQNRSTVLPLAVKALESIFNEERGHNICVHAVSYENVRVIRELISPVFRSRLMWHASDNRQEVVDLWKKSKDKVLLAVALTEGQDFNDDSCRAQVIFKVPYPNIQDKRVAYRLNKNKDWVWYYNQALIDVEQAYGRVVRSSTDWGRTYVVDSSITSLLSKCKKDVSPWFAEALPSEWKKIVTASNSPSFYTIT